MLPFPLNTFLIYKIGRPEKSLLSLPTILNMGYFYSYVTNQESEIQVAAGQQVRGPAQI